MSNALAIATVTRALVQRLSGPVGAAIAGALVVSRRPDSGDLPDVGVNIYLYRVSTNTAIHTVDLPMRNAPGSPLRRSAAALDLHYLFTFYGDDSALDAERLLGVVARELHAGPFLDRVLVASVQTGDLAASNLADQPELVRLTPVNFSLEEMSKLWSVFLKTGYILSMSYTASAVLIEPDGP
jgi:hypothetical protein